MKFNYQARTKDGEIQAGTVEASSKDAALVLLQTHGLVVTLLEGIEKEPFYTKKIEFFKGVSKKDIVVFSRQLSLMFKSRIPLLQSLQTLAEQSQNANLKEQISSIAQAVEGGTLFSQALARYPRTFSAFYVNLVKSGEASGTLSESLDYLAKHLEREYFLLSKIRGAMLYPVLVLVVVVAVLVIMVYFVVPQLTEVLEAGGEELPLITTAVISFTDFFKSWGWALAVLFIALLVFLLQYIKTSSGKKTWDGILLRIPLLNSFLKTIYVSRFAENLATLVKGGLPISRALEITGDVVGNESYRKVIFDVRSDVRKGEQISRLLSEHTSLFPPILTQMIMVGEKTGTLDQTLMNVVDFYHNEIDRSTESFTKLLEPLLVIFLGAVVAILIAALLLPIYTMTAI